MGPIDSRTLAHEVHEAADQVVAAGKEGHLGGAKVLISRLKDTLAKHPQIGPMTDQEFKSHLIRSHEAGHLELSRSDLLDALPHHELMRSRVHIPGTAQGHDGQPIHYYHFVRVRTK